ncbi:hypothetical protein G0U57_016792, partial [Chelydra serpentina]
MCGLTPYVDHQKPARSIFETRKMMIMMLKIAHRHSKEVEKPFSPTARNSLSPWSQYPTNPPKACSQTLKAEKGPLLQ